MAAAGEWVSMMRSEVDGVGSWSGDGVLGAHWWLPMECWSVGCLAMWVAGCGAIVSLLVMLISAVASWMFWWERR